MPRLLIANDSPEPEQVFGYDVKLSKSMAIWAMRILWHIKDDDIVVLPQEPDTGHLQYITELTGIQYKSLRIIVAPQGDAANLTAGRVANKALCNEIIKALSGRHLESILPLFPSPSVVMLARFLGAESSVPGAAFASQDGGALANSKVVFRAIAAGNNVPIPAGSVSNDPAEAEQLIADLLITQKAAAIVKKDFGQGCRGNEVLSHIDGVIPNGGRRGLVLPNRAAIKAYIDENWHWLTDSGHHFVVVEHYFPGSVAIFAEFNLTDRGVEFAGLGEMLATPIADGQVIPPIGLSPITIAKIVDGGHRLSAGIHAMGYRGTLSADAIVTPEGKVFFTEYNGRITGSTHLYATIGARILGGEWMQRRILLERRGWSAPSFQAAVDMLKESGLAFNHETRTGVILTGTFIPTRQVISYTIVGEDLAAAMYLEEQLHRVSPRAIEISI